MMQLCLGSRWLRISTLLAVMGLAWSMAMAVGSSYAAQQDAAWSELVYVGMQDPGIRGLHLDTRDGSLKAIGPVAEGLRATWLLAHPKKDVLYAVDDDNAREGSVTAFAVERTGGTLRPINVVPTRGKGTTFLSLDLLSSTILASSYGSGSTASIAVNNDGSLGALVSSIAVTGSGPNRRQASAHNHGAVVDPGGNFALVTDLGADRVFVHRFDRATHTLLADDGLRTFVAPAGSGPRHLVFGADGRFAYLLNELTAQVMVLRWDGAQGKLFQEQAVSISSAAFGGARSGAEVIVSRDGNFLYAEDRGENTLVVYRIDRHSGRLELEQRIGSQGQKPWGMALDPSGRWMLVANQGSGSVNVFAVDPVSGRLSATSKSVEIARPVSLAFLP